MDETQQAIPEQSVELSFDLSKISLDEMLDVLELAGKDKSSFTPQDFANLIRSMRKALVSGSRPLTGADVQPVLEGFIAYAMSGGEKGKN